MGSSSSKNTATDSPLPPPSSPAASSSSSSSTAVVRRSRSTRTKVFQSSCLGSRDSDNEATQVYALQRLGRRFENQSGHERSCVLSGQQRTGHCTCRSGTRGANLDSDSGARASISRIVMLAEALFEVLDEIHQQSVVLSSQPSVSSIGSVPAPIEVVESLPVRSYNKFCRSSNDEVAQCYICLVEYEEGDTLRTLPCHHEFHRTCVDKWLKEIHRVCPLCRGDICQSDSFQGNV